MSQLYLRATTDMLKKGKTATANYVGMGYNPGDPSKKIHVTLSRDGKNLELEVKDSHRNLLVCTGNVKDGLKECEHFNYKGVMKKVKSQRILKRK